MRMFKITGCESYRLNSELYPGNKMRLVGCYDNTPTRCCTHIIYNTLGKFVIVVPVPYALLPWQPPLGV